MKIQKYKVRGEDLQDAIIAGVVAIVVVIFFIEKHRREGGCTECQQNAARSRDEQDLITHLTTIVSSNNIAPVITTGPFTVEQLRRGY